MAGSMQLSQELLRIYSSRGCTSRSPVAPNVTEGKRRVQLVNANLSSRALRQDVWSLHIMSSIRWPLSPLRGRRRVLVCKAFLSPGGGSKIPVPEAAALVFKRTCDALVVNPLLLKLIPPVGIIVLAAWGLGPLVQLGRSVFLQKSDNSWEKSSAHYVLTSYVQPLLLWTGATLVCRALDPLVLPSVASQAVKQRLLNFVRSLSTVLAFAYCISSLIQQAQKFFAGTNTNDSSDANNMGFSFAGKAVYTAVWVAAVSLFMELLGYSTQKWVTAGGFGTVLITLAGREILTNFLSSVMIHATRPFVLNEWIQTKIQGYEVSGTVEHVGWWSPTIIRGDDREAVHIPNHKFSVNVVRNLSQKTHWRIKTHLAISHLDVNKINKIVADMRKVLAKNSQVEQQKLHRRVFLENINPDNQALMILVSCFVKTSHFGEYLGVKEAILMDLLRVVSHHKARLATPIRTVQKYYSDADFDNVPFDDSIFTRPRAATRPYLLIEPSYKVSDDKVKTPTHAAGTSEERDAKSEAVPEYEFKESEPGPPAIPDPRKDKSTASVTSASGANSKVSATQAPETQPGNSVPDNPVQLNVDKTNPSEGTANVLKEMGARNSEEISLGGMQRKSSTTNPMPDSERSANSAAISQTNQETEKSVASPSAARPPMEENLILDVALEGSKRTLPIDEEIAPSPFPTESKELTANRNGGAASSGAKEKKNGQAPTVKRTP